MPGNIGTSSPTTVLPASVASAYSLALSYSANVAEYVNGESQRTPISDSGRRSWEISRKLNAFQTIQLEAFYEARGGPAQAFFFYDPMETLGFLTDSTGASLRGRYIVRFDSGLSRTLQLGRSLSAFRLIQTT